MADMKKYLRVCYWLIALQTGAVAAAPVFGTIGIDSTGRLSSIQTVESQPIGAWNTDVGDTIVRGSVGDFDGDGLDDFLIRGLSGIGVLGNNASDVLTTKALAPYGSFIGNDWRLSASDEILAVGHYGSTPARAQILLKSSKGLAFARVAAGKLRVYSVIEYGTRIGGWPVSQSDRVIGKARLAGGGDALFVASNWGLSVWVPSGSSEPPAVLARYRNGTLFRSPAGATWSLDTTDPRFRFLGANRVDARASVGSNPIFVSPSGLAIFGWNTDGSIALQFALKDGHAFPGTSINATFDWLAEATNLDGTGGADLLYRHSQGISVLAKDPASWTFRTTAANRYTAIGTWRFASADAIAPLCADFDGDGQNDIPVSDGLSRVGFISVSAKGFRLVQLAEYSALPITALEDLIATGKFDHSGRYRVLFNNHPVPAKPAKTPVVTYHNDNLRTGLNPAERVLTPAAIRDRGFRLKFVSDLGGRVGAGGVQEEVWSQVLYTPGLSIDRNGDGKPDDGKRHDTFFVFTAANNLYAGDANTGAWLYNHQFKDPERPALRNIPNGIRSTPVIDYDSKTLYLVFSTQNRLTPGSLGHDPNLDRAYWLVAWDIEAGKILRQVKIAGSVPRADDTSLEFYGGNHTQRTALLLSKGSIYAAFGARPREQLIEYHGWVFRYDAKTFEQLGVFNSSPNERSDPRKPWSEGVNGAGIWQGGGGLAADERGQVYLITGNGPNDSAAKARGTYGDSFLKLIPRGYTLQLQNAYTPPGALERWKKDWDLGAGGPLLIPGTDRVVGGGKEGIYYLLSRGKMDLLQQLQAYDNLYDSCRKDATSCWKHHSGWAGGPHLHGNPAYWNGYIYQQAEMDYLKAYRYNFATGLLDTKPLVASDRRIQPDAWQGTGYTKRYMTNQLSISSRGNTQGSGVVWAILAARMDGADGVTDRRVTNRLTAAYDAGTLQCLWSVDFTGTGDPSHMPKQTPPTIADGKVFVPNNANEVRVYELGPPGGGGGKPDCGGR